MLYGKIATSLLLPFCGGELIVLKFFVLIIKTATSQTALG